MTNIEKSIIIYAIIIVLCGRNFYVYIFIETSNTSWVPYQFATWPWLTINISIISYIMTVPIAVYVYLFKYAFWIISSISWAWKGCYYTSCLLILLILHILIFMSMHARFYIYEINICQFCNASSWYVYDPTWTKSPLCKNAIRQLQLSHWWWDMK